jgi:hypothetical protein
MSKRGTYLGGHTVIRTPRPWWLPEDIPLEQTGHLNSPGQLKSDLQIVHVFLFLAAELNAKRTATAVDREAVGRKAEELTHSLGADAAIAASLDALTAELELHSKDDRAPYVALLSLSQPRRRGVRPGKRERTELKEAARKLRGAEILRR